MKPPHFPPHITLESIDAIITGALEEDVGDGDVTTLNTIATDSIHDGTFLAKAEGVIAGLWVAARVFEKLDPDIIIQPLVADGASVMPGTRLAVLRGKGRALLTAERTALNLLQRMSGIATATNRFVSAVDGSNAIILDTRKTVPGLRALDKWAVILGGGRNHRFGLYDMALIKDNHIAAVGSIWQAVARIREGDRSNLPIEVEVTDLIQLQEAIDLDVDRIMLDNMSNEMMREAVIVADGRIPLEASGNVNLESIAAIAATGVDYISIGSLTHSVKALDISLELTPVD